MLTQPLSQLFFFSMQKESTGSYLIVMQLPSIPCTPYPAIYNPSFCN